MISIVYIFLRTSRQFGGNRIELRMRNNSKTNPYTTFGTYCFIPNVKLQHDVTEFSVRFDDLEAGNFFTGARVLFSFHKRESAPERLPSGLWNCSVPYASDFLPHFECNQTVECAGGEDEMWCPDTTCQQGQHDDDDDNGDSDG
ncbi:hypothetical protein V1264_016498 [Littorina saxatilis]|uniref:Uncharacterized protein n=1 Tax=Littorina saxatilis TaxID=31220 RepID=A0AAN9BPM8_9CAEN